MKKNLIFFVVIVLVLLAFSVDVKVSVHKNVAKALEVIGFSTATMLKSPNGVVWTITIDDNGILGTDSIGVSQ
jgi:hypothetical protein